ncbi:MAG: hypothetical protein BWX97_01942 [Firmicutes bacterium ADurb.Bin146]|nr:MAG: hypothetical protein BWX97_01942 [Firmicutes bacterium ADurb.Bin146]
MITYVNTLSNTIICYNMFMKILKTNKHISRVIKKAYKAIEDLTPLEFDCGQLCNNKCCKEGSEGMYLFPFEFQYLIDKTDKDIIHTDNDFDLLICNGKCDRKYRPLACRIFPLFPYVNNKGEIEVKFDLRARNICPLQFKDMPEIQIQKRFVKRIKNIFKKLIKYQVFYDYCRKLTEEINFLKKFY